MEEVPLPPSMKRSEDMIRERLHLLFDLVQILTDYVNSLLRMLDVTVVRS